MKRHLFVVWATLGVAGCREEVQVSPRGDESPSSRLLWLRNTSVFDASRGTVLRRIEAPALVELGSEGSVRGAPGSAGQLDGYLEPALLASPLASEGPALYAQRVGELHWNAPDGPLIGYVYPGAFVSVAALGKESVVIAVPGFAQPSSKPGAPVLAFVRADVFGPEPRALERPASEGRKVEDYPADVALTTSAESDESFAATLCGDVVVLGEQAQRSLIAQYHAGVELRGWVDAPVGLARGPVRCTLRQVYRESERLISIDGPTAADRRDVSAVPAGYLRAELDGGELLAPRLRRGEALYWLVRGQHGPACQGWKPEQVSAEGEAGGVSGRLRRSASALNGAGGAPWFRLSYRAATKSMPGELVLFGPQLSESGGAGSGYRAGTLYSIVGATPDALRVLPSSFSESVVAWHPDDEERWFFSEASCEAAAHQAAPAWRTGSGSLPGGFHVNPFPELDG